MKENKVRGHFAFKTVTSIVCDLIVLWCMGYFSPNFPNTTMGSLADVLYGITMIVVMILIPKFICKKTDEYYDDDK